MALHKKCSAKSKQILTVAMLRRFLVSGAN
nr:MAG TPA: hypothetical protein [Caudoviricetes sp.]